MHERQQAHSCLLSSNCRQTAPNAIYNFATWGEQAVDFIAEFIKEPAVLVCNSVGGLTGLQAAQQDTSLVKAVQVTSFQTSSNQ